MLTWRTETSIVIGVYGEWGSGKSSILNLAVQHVERTTEGLPEDQRPLIIRFNAWGYSQQNQIVTAFFNTISAHLRRDDSTGAARDVAKRMQAYSALLAPVQFAASLIHPGLGELAKGTRRVFERGAKTLEGMADLLEKDSETVKGEINDLLREKQRQIIVVIDDIDRLSKEEIRQVFQLLKNNADFAYMIYLVALDAGVVGEALESLYGPNFLDKIVQVQVPVPRPDEQEILRLLYEGIDDLQERTGAEYTDEQFLNLFLRGPARWLRHTRDVTRYLNALNFSVPLVKDDVYVPEFMVLEAMRLFRPKTYSAIQTYKTYLLGQESTVHMMRQKSTWFERFKEACADEWESEELLEELLPLIQRHTRDVNFGGSFWETWSREKRVASSEHFDIYFSFGISSRSLSQQEFTETLRDIENPDALREHVLRMRSTGRLRPWLRRLYEHAREFNNPRRAVLALLSVGDLTPEDDGAFLDLPSSVLLMFTARRAIELLPPPERFAIVAELISEDVDLFCAARVVAYEAEETKEGQPNAISEAQVSELQETIIQRIKDEAERSALTDRAHLPGLIGTWLNWGQEEEVKAFLQTAVNDDRMLRLLPVFVSNVRVSDGDSVVMRRELAGQPSTLKLINFESLQRRLSALDDEFLRDLTDQQRQIIEFLKTLDQDSIESMGDPLTQRVDRMRNSTRLQDSRPAPSSATNASAEAEADQPPAAPPVDQA